MCFVHLAVESGTCKRQSSLGLPQHGHRVIFHQQIVCGGLVHSYAGGRTLVSCACTHRVHTCLSRRGAWVHTHVHIGLCGCELGCRISLLAVVILEVFCVVGVRHRELVSVCCGRGREWAMTHAQQALHQMNLWCVVWCGLVWLGWVGLD